MHDKSAQMGIPSGLLPAAGAHAQQYL